METICMLRFRDVWNTPRYGQRCVLLLSAAMVVVVLYYAVMYESVTLGKAPICTRSSSGENTTMERMETKLLSQDIVEPKFSVSSDFKFPHPTVFQPTVKILESDWVQQLKAYLLSIHPARSLTITVATKSFIPKLLNWLIAAHILVEPPMEHVLVLALDKEVHSLLAQRKIPCIHVPSTSVLKRKLKGVTSVWMTRFAVLRLINHWGYDVLQLDNDAIPLRNPHTLLDAYIEYDIVSSRGNMPFSLTTGPWKFSLCMGAILLRGTQGMEALWNIMGTTGIHGKCDDQRRINFALYKSNLEWSLSEEPLDDRVIVGASQNSTTRVANLPERYICRRTCDLSSMSEYYIWHQLGGKHKAEKKSEQNTLSQMWFLRSNYKYKLTAFSTTGMKWLEQLIIPDSLQNIRHRLTKVQNP